MLYRHYATSSNAAKPRTVELAARELWSHKKKHERVVRYGSKAGVHHSCDMSARCQKRTCKASLRPAQDAISQTKSGPALNQRRVPMAE